MRILIDPPSPFDTYEVWASYISRLEKMLATYPGDADILDALEAARDHIASMQ